MQNLQKGMMLGALFMLFALAGCAFTSGTIRLDYQPPSTNVHFNAKKTVQIGSFVDERGKNPLLLANKYNGYGQQTSGGYLAERPVADMLRDTISESLISSGVTVADNQADLLLRARLIQFSFENEMGFWSSNTTLHIQMEFSLYDNKSNSLLWKEMVVANGSRRSASMFAEDYIKPSFAEATDDLVKKFLDLPTLKGSLEND